MGKIKKKKTKIPRKNRITIYLNEKEMGALNNYCNKYKKRRSSLIRETIMHKIMYRMIVEDYPTLFKSKDL